MTFPFLSSEEFDEQAHQLYDAGEYDEALEMLREGLKRYPNSADLHVGLGYVRLAREEFAWAKQSFGTALGFEADHEDGWVGMGETLLKFGETQEALRCFRRIDELDLSDDLELGLAIGRALYREGLYELACERLEPLVEQHPDSAELHAALGYAQHAMGGDADALRTLRTAVCLDPALHEVRIYLSHMLFERGDLNGALRELDHVPASEHWDPLSVWRYLELKYTLGGHRENDAELEPWRERLRELRSEPDSIDHLLAEVETSFDLGAKPSRRSAAKRGGADLLGGLLSLGSGSLDEEDGVHRVRTPDGAVFTGTWDDIVREMRDLLADPAEPVGAFMQRTAEHIRGLTGREPPCNDAEAFLRESARLGFLQIEE